MLSVVALHVLGVSRYDFAHHAATRVDDETARKPYAQRFGGQHASSCVGDRSEDGVSADVTSGDGTLHEIFLVPHTHDDVGWLYTPAGYFNRSVSHILDSVTADLSANPSHRFIWSEIKWIEMWWPHQNETTKRQFKRLVANGQLEFVGAGWSQHDEVTPSYRDMVANTQAGHEYLRGILGPLEAACPQAGRGRCVRFGWQIDMFAGYSAASPSLSAMAGYDGMVIRFEGPPDMRAQFDAEQAYEFLWAPSAHLDTRMMTHVIRWNYGDMLLEGRNGSEYGFQGPDVSFAFDRLVLRTQADVERYAAALVRWSKARGAVYRGNRHLAVWGSDFQFTDAGLWFRQMDRILDEVNRHPTKYGATIRYSTLSTYFDDLHRRNLAGEPSAQLPVKKGLDFQYGWPHSWSAVGEPEITYTANFSWQYQTGATSSRPAHKARVRASAAALRTAQVSHALALASGALHKSAVDQFDVAWDALGVAQHHDSLPGTMQTAESVECPDYMPIIDGLDHCNRTTDPSRQVLEDYTLRLNEADEATKAITITSVEAAECLPPGSLSFDPPPRRASRAASAAAAATAEATEAASVVVYNPTSHARTERVRVQFDQPQRTAAAAAASSAHASAFYIPSVYLETGGGSGSEPNQGEPVAAQMEINDGLAPPYCMCLMAAGCAPCPNPAALPLKSALFFLAVVPPLSSSTYSLRFDRSTGGALVNSTSTAVPTVTVGAEAVAQLGLGFAHDPFCQRVHFSAADGLMSEISVQSDGLGCGAGGGGRGDENSGNRTTRARVRQTYHHYVDAVGGAYCLIEQTRAVELPPPFYVALVAGPVMQEVVQNWAYGNGLQQRVRITAPPPASSHTGASAASAGPTVEVEHASGRLAQNRELVSRIETDLCTEGLLYTEASGFSELYARPFNATASVAQNYHALVQTAAIRDAAPAAAAHGAGCAGAGRPPRQLTVITRRTMGVASLSAGAVEYMLMRRIADYNDNQGPWPLDDRLPMEGDVLRLMLLPQPAAEASRFTSALELEEPLTVLYRRHSAVTSRRPRADTTQTAPGKAAASPPLGFPRSVWFEVLARAPGAPPNATFALRMQNTLAGGAPITIASLSRALGLPTMDACVETTSTLQQTRASNDAVRLQWRAEGETWSRPPIVRRGAIMASPPVVSSSACDEPIVLDSLDIRTFTFGVQRGAS